MRQIFITLILLITMTSCTIKEPMMCEVATSVGETGNKQNVYPIEVGFVYKCIISIGGFDYVDEDEVMNTISNGGRFFSFNGEDYVDVKCENWKDED